MGRRPETTLHVANERHASGGDVTRRLSPFGPQTDPPAGVWAEAGGAGRRESARLHVMAPRPRRPAFSLSRRPRPAICPEVRVPGAAAPARPGHLVPVPKPVNEPDTCSRTMTRG